MTGHEPGPVPGEREARLAALGAKRRELRDRECELEVDRIAADAALKTRAAPPGLDIDPAVAAAIDDALTRRRALAGELAALDEPRPPPMTSASQPLELGRDALREWLEAPAAGAGGARSSVAQTLFGAVSIAALVAAFTVHLAFLLLLVPLGAVSGLMWSGQDSAWRRIGARRHFEATSLEPPAAWEQDAIERRLEELEAAIRAPSGPGESPLPAAAPRSRSEIADELEQAGSELAALAAETGLDLGGLDESVERRIGLIGRSFRAARDLESVQAELRRVAAEIDDLLAPTRD